MKFLHKSERKAADTFERFIVGQSNRFAYTAALAVAENPGDCNPLVIYGAPGLGKTHLLRAIGHAVQARNPSATIVYVDGSEFAEQMVHSIRERTQEKFRKKYRNADVLLVDDIQFIAGKEATQEEFFHVFNSVCEAGGQVVIASSRPPKDLERLDDLLRSRFEGGLMVEIQPPNMETRKAIICAKSKDAGLELSDAAAAYMAERVTMNVSQIEGVLHQLASRQKLLGEAITLDSVKRAVAAMVDAATAEARADSP